MECYEPLYRCNCPEENSSSSSSASISSNSLTLEERVLLLEQKLDRQKTPAGTLAFYANTIAPEGWLICKGQFLDKTIYADLYAAIGNQYGESGNTFKLPDTQGLFPRALDFSGQIDPNRRIGTYQGDAIRNIRGRFRSMIYDGFYLDDSGATKAVGNFSSRKCGDNPAWVESTHGHEFNASWVVPTADENRPKNIAFTMIIKY